MKRGLAKAAVVLAISSAISIGCGSDDDSSMSTGGAGTGGSSKAGATSTAGRGGMSSGGNGTGGNGTGGNGTGGNGTGGNGTSGNSTGGLEMMAGTGGMFGEAGEGGAGGAGPRYTADMITRGTEIVRGAALCGGCHTAQGGLELGGNPAFKNSMLPAPNLTSDATGLGHWTDAQIINAFRNGVDDQGRHLDPAMPYWLFHNMSDDDALAVVAYLRSLPKVVASVGDATPVTPLAPSAFPDSSLTSGDANYAAAQTGKYLVSGVAQCVKCHSPSTAGLPSGSFFSGVAPTQTTPIFASNITPDVTGISGWTADEVATALKMGKNKANVTLCGSMPAGVKGYGNLTDADAHAIGVYLTTIPAVSNGTADPTGEPACP